MFVTNSNSNYLEGGFVSSAQTNEASAPSNLKSARKALHDAFVKTGFSDRQGKLRVRLGGQSPLSDEGRKKLNALLMHQMPIEGRQVYLQDYMRFVQMPRTGLTYWKYLRGSYAAYLIDPLSRLGEALELFYKINPKARDIIVPAFAAYCSFKNENPLEEPNDADFADLYYHKQRSIPEDTVQKVRENVISWMATLVNKPPEVVEKCAFQTLFIPEPNHLTRTAEKIAIITLKTDPPAVGAKELKVDRVIGELKNYCLFSRDDFYIDFQRLPYYPQSFQNDFWQCVLDREMQVIRLEERHRDDFSAVLAAVEHYTKGAELDESELTLSDIFDAFLTPLTEEENKDEKKLKMQLTDAKLLNAVLKRIENHSVDPLSFLVNLCAKFPLQFSDRREVLWKGVLSRLDTQKLRHFGFLTTNTPSFDLFVHDVLPLQGTEIVEGHHFRIERAAGDRIESTQRHFRKLMILQNNYRPNEGHLDAWQQGCKALHTKSKGSLLTVDFVDLLIEDLLDGSVYSEEEVDAVLSFCGPYLGKLSPKSWLEDLLKGPFWEVALKHWQKTSQAMSIEKKWEFLQSTLPKGAKIVLSDLLVDMLVHMDASSRMNYLLENYGELHAAQGDIISPILFSTVVHASTQEQCRAASVLFTAGEWTDLKAIVLLINPVPEAIVPEWTKWVSGLIAREHSDGAATRLFCQLNKRVPILKLPQKQADRIHVGIQELSEEELISYIRQRIEAGDLLESLILLSKASEIAPLLEEIVKKLPVTSTELFKECIPYLVEHLHASTMSVVPLLAQNQQIELLLSLSFDFLVQCKGAGVINDATYASVLTGLFHRKPSLLMLWELEYVQASADESVVRKVQIGYQGAKNLSLSNQSLSKRLNWLSDRKRYLECFSLLKKCSRFESAKEWKQRLLASYMQESSVSELSAFFNQDKSCAIPAGILINRFDQEEDVRKCFVLYQRVKARLSDPEKMNCLMVVLKKQVVTPFLNKMEMQALLPEAVALLDENCPPAVCGLLSTAFLQSEKQNVLSIRLSEPHRLLRLDAFPVEMQNKWISLYAYYQLPLPSEYCSQAVEALSSDSSVDPVWLFRQIADKQPHLLSGISATKLPLDQLFDPVFDQMVHVLSSDQLWEVHRSVESDHEKTLRLFKAWHLRGDLDHKTIQRIMLKNAQGFESLAPLMMWLKEGEMQPVAEWIEKFKLLDDVHLSICLSLLNRPKDHLMKVQLVEHGIQHHRTSFCLTHASVITQIAMEADLSEKLQDQLQEILLADFVKRQVWTFEELQELVAIVDLVKNPHTTRDYHHLLCRALIDLSSTDVRARISLLELMKRQIVYLTEDHLPRMLQFIEDNYEAINTDLSNYDGFLMKMLADFSHSEAVISQFLKLWQNWKTLMRVRAAILWIVEHPGSAEPVQNLLTERVIQNALDIDDIQLATQGLGNRISQPAKWKIDLFVQLICSKKALHRGDANKGVSYLFGYFNLLSSPYAIDLNKEIVTKQLQNTLERLLELRAFGEINLLFERYSLYLVDPKKLITYQLSLDNAIQERQTSEEATRDMCMALQTALEHFFAGAVHSGQCDTDKDRILANHLRKLHEKGSPVPQKWYPSFQDYIFWHCTKLQYIMRKISDHQFRVFVPSLISFLNGALAHPACNESTIIPLRALILDLLDRADGSTCSLVVFKQFVLIESMHPLPQRIYEHRRMKSNPEQFTRIMKDSIDELLENVENRGSLMDYQRAFAFFKYTYRSYKHLLGNVEADYEKLYEALLAKLPRSSKEFRSSIVAEANSFLNILGSTKYTKQMTFKLQKWKPKTLAVS